MKVGVVSNSQLARHDRWDAGFHLAMEKLKPNVREWVESRTSEHRPRLLEVASMMPPNEVALQAVARGRHVRTTKETLKSLSAVELALYLSLCGVDEVREHARRLRKEAERLDTLAESIESEVPK